MVCFNNKISKISNVTSGVPQGSHLGPLLFGLMINDLPYVIKSSTVLMYADDVKLCLSMCLPNSYNDLQLDLNCLYTWCMINMLNLNYSKCNFMTFYRCNPSLYSYSIGNNALERIFSVQDLGVLFDHKLSFKDHISTITNKARSLLAFMKRCSREFDDPYTTKLLFVSLVRPSMEYCSCIWSPQISCYQNMLESVQIQFLLFALRVLNWDTGSRLPSYHVRLTNPEPS